MSYKRHFSSGPRLSPFSKTSTIILSVIEAAMKGFGAITIAASKKGLVIRLRGKVLARGRTPDELTASYEAALQKAKQSQSSTL